MLRKTRTTIDRPVEAYGAINRTNRIPSEPMTTTNLYWLTHENHN